MNPGSDPTDHRHLLLIGGQRCGTTWLQQVLEAHGDIRVPRVVKPEPKYFLDRSDHAEYDALFAPEGGSWLLDKSTTYLERADAATRAAASIPDAVVVVVVRDPVERAFSNWRFSVANGLEDQPIDVCLTEAGEERPWSGLSTSPFQYLRRGRYSELLAPWEVEFGPTMVVLQYEQMIDTGAAEYLTRRFDRVGLAPSPGWPDLPPPANAAPGDDPMPSRVRDALHEYYREGNRQLARFGVDVDRWTR